MVVDADLGIAGQRRLDAQQVLLAAEMRWRATRSRRRLLQPLCRGELALGEILALESAWA